MGFGARTFGISRFCGRRWTAEDMIWRWNSGLTRHMQLKSSYRGAQRSEVTAHVKLLDRPSACILWIFFDPDTLLLGPFLWFGGAAGEKIPSLGDRIAKHTKPNAMLEKADRPAHRVIPKSRFAKLDTIDDVIRKLIGVS